MTDSPEVLEAQAVELSLPPSAIRLPEGYDLEGAYGSIEADRIATVLILYGQVKGRDGWEGAPLAGILDAVVALLRSMGDGGGVIHAFLDGSPGMRDRVRQMAEAGYLSYRTDDVGGTPATKVIPTEKFLEPLARYRV